MAMKLMWFQTFFIVNFQGESNDIPIFFTTGRLYGFVHSSAQWPARSSSR